MYQGGAWICTQRIYVRIGISKLNFIELDLSVSKGREMQAGPRGMQL